MTLTLTSIPSAGLKTNGMEMPRTQKFSAKEQKHWLAALKHNDLQQRWIVVYSEERQNKAVEFSCPHDAKRALKRLF